MLREPLTDNALEKAMDIVTAVGTGGARALWEVTVERVLRELVRRATEGKEEA